MTAVLVVLKRVPIWIWIVMAVLCWGGFQRHSAKAAERKESALREAVVQREAAEAKQAVEQKAAQLEAQRKVIDDATTRAAREAADAAAARASLQRLRASLAAGASNAASAPAAAGSPAAGPSSAVLADMLGRCAGRVLELAEFADAASGAGSACERSYDALTVR